MQYSFSRVESYDSCPYKWYLHYMEHLQTLPTDDPQNPLFIGSALHKGIETDVQTALDEYFGNYPVINDDIITEAMKLEYWIPKVKALLPENCQHEVKIEDHLFHGFLDLLVPCTKLDAELEHGQFDLYDFKYSNSVEHYLQSNQLHVYKYELERITGKRIRNMFFMFIPKSTLKKGKMDSLEYRKMVMQDLEHLEIKTVQVPYDPNNVIDFLQTIVHIDNSEEYPKKPSFLCKFCEFTEYCQKGRTYMLLPSSERRNITSATKRKIWIYGQAFSGKTTFADQAPAPLNLNTDGNIQFVTMPYLPIKDTYEGRQKVLAWKVFKDAIDELEKKNNDFKTIVVDLLEDTYQSCRLYMYDKLGLDHESDDPFKAWDEVRTEYLSTIRKLTNLDYENIILISHEDSTRDITKKSGDKTTAITPNIQAKIANKIAGMVDIVARIVVEDDGSRTLNFKSNEVVFGGGRLKGINVTQIPLDWNELVKVYDEANSNAVTATEKPQKAIKEKTDIPSTEPINASELKGTVNSEGEFTPAEKKHTRRTRKSSGDAPHAVENPQVENVPLPTDADAPAPQEDEPQPQAMVSAEATTGTPRRRQRKVRE